MLKEYVTFRRLSTFFDNLKLLFATKAEVKDKADRLHKHDSEYQHIGDYASANHKHDADYVRKDESGGVVPTYVKTEAISVSDKITAVRDAYSFVFGAISDLHTDGNDTSATSILHAGMGLDEINKRTNLDALLNFGDIISGKNLESSYIEGFPYVRNCLHDVIKDTPYIQMQGNHDEYDSAYTEAEEKQKYFAYIGANNTDAVTDWNNRFRNYGYRDFDSHKMRVIYLNSVDLTTIETTDATLGSNDCYISGAQYKWLIETAFNFSNKDDAENWSFIVCSHHPLNWYGVTMNFGTGRLPTILKAYKDKTSGSVTADGITINYNFTGAQAGLIAHFHGHTHNFRNEVIGGVPTITIPNACFDRNNEYGTKYGDGSNQQIYWGDADANGVQRVYNKTANSAQDTAFNVVVIDRTNEEIHCFNYGAGFNRVIPYGVQQKVYHNISYTLSNVISSNSASMVEDGASYTTTLSTNEDYTLEGATVSVVMGGIDITTTAYSNGVISIGSVTDDVVITATAAAASKYTNLIDTIGYTDGIRLSTSSDSTKEAAGYTTTGYIPVVRYDEKSDGQPDVIHTKGIDFRPTTHSNCAYAIYNASKVRTTGGYLNATTTANISIVFDADGNLTFSTKDSIPRGGAFIRLTGYGTGANLIVTKNQEITD